MTRVCSFYQDPPPIITMEIKLRKEEKLKILYDECPRCHKPFNAKKHKKTEHHILPKFLNPKTEVTITICKECHEELNSYYKEHDISDIKHKVKKGSYKEFKQNYDQYREEYRNKETNRGQFGEKLWLNLTSYLKFLDERIENKK